MNIDIISGRLGLGAGGQLDIQFGSYLQVSDNYELPPDQLRSYLLANGWQEGNLSGMPKLQNKKYVCRWYTWEQAMAIEFHRFITIGGSSNG